MTTPAAPAVRAAHPYYMHDAIAAVIADQGDRCAEIGATLAGKRRIYIVGIGTSWHAAIAGTAIMNGGTAGAEATTPDIGTDAGPECFAANSFEFCHAPPPVTGHDAVIVISHRGTKRASYEALDLAI